MCVRVHTHTYADVCILDTDFFPPSHRTVLWDTLIANVYVTELTVSAAIKRNYKDGLKKMPNQAQHSYEGKLGIRTI